MQQTTQSKASVIKYETGCNCKFPLFSYEGCTYEEAYQIVLKYRKKNLKPSAFTLVTKEKVAEMKKAIAGYSPHQWYIIALEDIARNDG